MPLHLQKDPFIGVRFIGVTLTLSPQRVTMFSLRVHSLDTNHPVSLEAAEFTTISAAKSYSAVAAARSNPRFSQRRGIAHLFRRRRSIITSTSLPSHGGASTLLFVVAVPNYLSFNDFIRFCEPRLDHVAKLVFIRNDAMEDRYSVVVRFTNEMKADEFYGSFNGMKYSPSEAEVCHILFLESVEYTESDQIAGTPPDECTQLPVCPVCLERLDSESSGIATTLCDHSFPCPCTSKWTHLSCQVCRLCHERDNTPACSVCGLTENLWVCVICGSVGCGRYKGQHALRHYEDTKHYYSLDLKSQKIWDYEGHAYVHRLNQSKIDGKLGTDVNSECRVLGGDCEGCECSEESGISGALYSSEVENIADEYNRLLASQLETQRQFYESLLMEARSKTDNLVSEAVEMAVNLRIQDIQSKLEKASQEKKAAEDACHLSPKPDNPPETRPVVTRPNPPDKGYRVIGFRPYKKPFNNRAARAHPRNPIRKQNPIFKFTVSPSLNHSSSSILIFSDPPTTSPLSDDRPILRPISPLTNFPSDHRPLPPPTAGDKVEDDPGNRVPTSSEQSTQSRRKRHKSARCWQSFQDLPLGPDGIQYARCMKCGTELKSDSAKGISSLNRHHDSCSALGVSPHTVVRSTHFQHERFCELVVEAIVMHDLPFSIVEYEGFQSVFEYISPDLRLPCRNTVRSRVTKIYEEEKAKVHQMLSGVKGRICLTSDLWSSITTDGYLALTAHFIDYEWTLQKKILSFSYMPPPHSGAALYEKIDSLISEWGIDRNMFSITLDNASANLLVEKLQRRLNYRGLLLMDGEFFHIRCCVNILNIIVQEGLKAIDSSVDKVRECVKYIKGSMARKQRFLECVDQVGIDKNTKSLKQDVPTRWNSTYTMLESAIHYRRALGHYALCDSDFTTCPSLEEWGRIEMISKFLGEFYEVTKLFSGTKYPTSNLFFPKVFVIQNSIQNAMRHQDEFMKLMGNQMNVKFQKYWSDYSTILAIAAVFDPRLKMSFVEWAHGKLYKETPLLLYADITSELSKIRHTLYALFEAYKEKWSTHQTDSRGDQNESFSYSQDADMLFQDFDVSYEGTSSNVRSELDAYLDEKRLSRAMKLDVLVWWKGEQFRYPVLSHLASDILSIPISTVASESAFSVAGRVLDQYRSSLLPETVEALLCTRDWLFNKKDQEVAVVRQLTQDVLGMTIDEHTESD